MRRLTVKRQTRADRREDCLPDAFPQVKCRADTTCGRPRPSGTKQSGKIGLEQMKERYSDGNYDPIML